MATAFAISEVKRAAMLTGTEYDSALPVWIATLEHQIEQFTGLSLTSRTETVYLDGRWHHIVILPGRPVSAVVSVREIRAQDASAVALPEEINFAGQNVSFTGTPVDPLTAGVDYAVRWDKNWSGTQYCLSGKLERRGRVWRGAMERKQGRVNLRRIKGQANIQIEYTYGFVRAADIPPVFLLAVAAGVQAYILRIPQDGVIPTSQSLDGASVGSQIDKDTDSAASGLNFPELGSLKSALSAYVAPRVF